MFVCMCVCTIHVIVTGFCAFKLVLMVVLSYAVPSGSFCGNSLVEKDEECDVGAGNTDSCCDEKCKLKAGARCRLMIQHC